MREWSGAYIRGMVLISMVLFNLVYLSYLHFSVNQGLELN